MRYLWLLLLWLGQSSLHADVLESVSAPGNSQSQQKQYEAGMRIYLEGMMPDGEFIEAKVRGDVTLQGSQYACANCHRRSGIGSSEGGDQVPPLVGEALFSPHTATLHDSYPRGGLNNETRPAYTMETLGRALRHGIDPAGRKLSPLMPRFKLTDSEVQALSTYLAGLSVTLPPGIDKREIHFATITTPGNEATGDAILEVLSTFFRDKNAGTRSEERRAKNAPYHREWSYESYRRWKLHEWVLKGPEHTWLEQLHTLYAKQPVFAILGGVGSGDWQPVHNFCEAQQLPCLMPHIPLPPRHANDDFYSLYFSRGVELEALALAKHLAGTTQHPQQIIQIRVRGDTAAYAAAQTLGRALRDDAAITLTEIVIGSDYPLTPDFWKALTEKYRGAAWVLWLDEKNLKGLDLAPRSSKSPATIYVSASLQQDITVLAQHPFHSRITLLTPYRAADNDNMLFRFRTWARLRQLPVRNLHIQSSSFLAATLAGETLMHMRSNLSREYFLELMEHNIDNMINPSLYPRISLAPGQRFAVKGCYIWEMAKGFETAQWIVP